MKKSLNTWLEEYGECHQNKWNVLIHKIFVPIIFISIYFMLYTLPFPFKKTAYINPANVIYLPLLFFYFRLNWKVGLMMLVAGILLGIMSTAFHINCLLFDFLMFKLSLILFVIGWIGQFIGHKIEGKKPSFFEDLKFLLIGPIWVFYPKRKKEN